MEGLRISSSDSATDEEDAEMKNPRNSEKLARRFLESYYINPLQLKAQMRFKSAAETAIKLAKLEQEHMQAPVTPSTTQRYVNVQNSKLSPSSEDGNSEKTVGRESDEIYSEIPVDERTNILPHPFKPARVKPKHNLGNIGRSEEVVRYSEEIYEEPESVYLDSVSETQSDTNSTDKRTSSSADMDEEEVMPVLRRKKATKVRQDHQQGFVTLPNKEKRRAFVYNTKSNEQCKLDVDGKPEPMTRKSIVKNEDEIDYRKHPPTKDSSNIFSGAFDNNIDLNMQIPLILQTCDMNSLPKISQTQTLPANMYQNQPPSPMTEVVNCNNNVGKSKTLPSHVQDRKRPIPAPRNSRIQNRSTSNGSTDQSSPETSPRGTPLPSRKDLQCVEDNSQEMVEAVDDRPDSLYVNERELKELQARLGANHKREVEKIREGDSDSDEDQADYENIDDALAASSRTSSHKGENAVVYDDIYENSELIIEQQTQNKRNCEAEDTAPELPPQLRRKQTKKIQRLNTLKQKPPVTKQESVSIQPLRKETVSIHELSEDNEYYLSLIRKMSSLSDPSKYYTFKNSIGEGGSGKVFRATDKETKKEVAIKLMDLLEQISIFGLLAQEISILRTVKHPNIINFIHCHLMEETKEMCIIMEYMDGLPLNDIVEPRKGISREPIIAAILRPCVNALDYVHDQNIIHRDIKSDNVLVGTNGVVKVIDFGACAKVWSSKTEKRKTHIGTPYWMAPEVIKAEDYNNKIDVWSLGIMAYECYRGTPPYYELNDYEALSIIAKDGVSPLFKKLGRASIIFKRFLERCCEKRQPRRAKMKELTRHPFVNCNLATIQDLSEFVMDTKKYYA